MQDILGLVEKNTLSLNSNCVSVTEEIDEIYRRLTKALKDRTDHLRSEMDRYLSTEMRNLTTLKENLELEIANIQSNCDLADKHMNDTVEWDDCELMDTKEIFMKTVEFIRNFEYENTDFNRKVRFTMALDPNQLVMSVSTYGDLNITPHAANTSPSQSGMLQPPGGPGLMRSKSDHRLAAQFRQQEAQGLITEEEPLLGGRKFGERPLKPIHSDKYGSDSRYGRSGGGGNDYDYEYDEPSSRAGKTRFRSRFVRGHQGDNDSDNEQSRNVKFNEGKEKEKEKITSTEDVAKGPLSGIFRISDSPRVMKRLQDQERGKKEKKEPVFPTPQPKPAQILKKPTTTARQLSEDDEIARIKRQNKGASSSSTTTTPTTTTPTTETDRPAPERVSALKQRTASDDSDHNISGSPVRRTPPTSVEVSYDEE